MSANNLAYWVSNPLDARCVRLLERVSKGKHRWASDRLNEAYLISQDCLVPDYENLVLKLTPKGQDALKFFGKHEAYEF
jgi:hypothetical protein